MPNLYILIAVLFLGIFLFLVQNLNLSKYKYLFRNTILSKSKKYELAPVLRGRVYYPRYFYIPSLKQYIVYSDVDETGDFRVYQNENKSNGKTYSLLDENGNSLTVLETPLSFSNRSGCFYGPTSYIPLVETGKSDELSYDQIHNAALDLGHRDFEKLFIQLYTSSEYIEFVNLRLLGDQIHEAGIVFRRQGKTEILLSGVRDSRMIRQLNEDRTINNFEDQYLPDVSKKETLPQSDPSIEMIRLETTNTNPFIYWRIGFKKEFKIKKYRTEYSSGLQGIVKIGFIPIYGPGESSGTTYVRFKTKGETFRIKILDVEKINFIPAYHLGLRTFQLPKNCRTQKSLVFMESVQDRGSNRLGGGVFVVRTATNSNPSSDIPSDMTEEHFNTLPVTLQEALLAPDNTTTLKINAAYSSVWIPEIERLKNLTHLEMNIGMTEIPDAIATFKKLKHLKIEHGNIVCISSKLGELKQLESLNLFSNKLREFPKVILELENLKKLNIGANKISGLPEDINKLKKLENLDIVLTDITSLPVSMIEMKELYIYDGRVLEKKMSSEYKHLFDYMKHMKNF
jgi:hypothetical protein